MSFRTPTHRIELALAGAGLLLLGGWAITLVSASAYQVRAARLLESLCGGSSVGDPRAAGKTRASAATEGVVGRIEIPSADVSAMIAEGVEPATLSKAVGHVPGTPFPGEHGLTVLAAHRDTYFRGIERVQPGDTVRVVTPDGAFVYRVASTAVVSPRDARVLRAGPRPALALVTCYPFRFLGPAPLRFVVTAAPASRLGGPRTPS